MQNLAGRDAAMGGGAPRDDPVKENGALPSEIARGRTASLQRDISEASRGSRRMDGRAAAVKGLASSVGIRLGEVAASFQMRPLVRQMDFLDRECAKVEAMVRELLERVEPLVLTIPGVSYTTGAQIVAETDDASRFRDAPALVSYASLNPSVNSPACSTAAGSRSPSTGHRT